MNGFVGVTQRYWFTLNLNGLATESTEKRKDTITLYENDGYGDDDDDDKSER